MKFRRKPQVTWTMNDVLFIQNNHDKMTLQQMADKLNRSYSSVKHKVKHLGLKPTPKREVLEYAYYVGDELIYVGKIEEIEKFTGIDRKNLFMYRLPSYKKRLKRELIEV